MTRGHGPSTRSVHAGVERHKPGHAITTPIVQSATYTFQNTDDLTSFMHAKIWTGATNGREEYGRYGNPTVHAVEQKLAQLDGAEDALLYSSGMAAVTSILLSSLPTDTHIIMTDDCYRRTRQFCNTFLKRLGIDTTVVAMGDYEAIEQAIDPKRTRFLISESPTNPYLRIADFERLADIGKKYRIRTLIDSTFGTPINQQPYTYGIDYIVHSGTKYLGGHHDILAGVVVGSRERIAALRDAQGVLGALVAPQTAFLLERGLRTLALRVERQNHSALAISQFLESHPKVARVWYPGLDSHPDHAVAVRQMKGFGGVVSFELHADFETTGRFIDAMTIPYIAPSLGGVESLIEQPAIMSYYEMDSDDRAAIGIRDSLVRLAVGIEDTDDLIQDLTQALEKI